MKLDMKYLEDGGLLIVGKETIKSIEIIAINDEIYGSGIKTSSLKYQLWDFRKVTDFISSTEDIRKMATQDIQTATINPEIIIAIVTPEDFGYGLSRMWQAFSSEAGLNSNIFRNMEDALAWRGAELKKLS